MLHTRIKNLILRLALPLLLILTLMTLTACIGMEPSKQVSRDREVAGFNKISLMSIGNIYIEQSEFESLRIEADETIIDNIITEVRSHELIINVKTGLFNFPFFKGRNMTPISYYITVKDLNTVDLFGSGNIFIKDLKTDRFSIHLIGSGDMDINLQAQETIIIISGAGDILLRGNTDQQWITINGSGDYMADDFFSNACMININGSGNALINASQVLDINIKGSGDVRYIGNPNVTQNVFGSGNIEKVD